MKPRFELGERIRISRSELASIISQAICVGTSALMIYYDDSRPRGYSQSHWRKIRKDRSPIRQKHIPYDKMFSKVRGYL